jgi:hypothetical protein
MERFVKMVKGMVLMLAVLAVLASVGPLSAQPVEEHDDGGGSGSGSLWHVVCQFDGNNNLLSKTCTSGGNFACAC